MRASRHINIPVFIPHRGCPHTCVFCHQGRISGATAPMSPSIAEALIEKELSTTGPYDEVEIAFFGGSFTGLSEPEMTGYLKLAQKYRKQGRIRGIRLSTRPDMIDASIISILQYYGVTSVELGVQSLDDEVLKMSKRGHTAVQSEYACHLVKESGIKLGIQTMLGLPGDSLEKALATAARVVELKPDMVRIYPSLVLKDTEMEDLYRQGRYQPLTLSEAVDWCASILPMYQEAGILVLRIGLHASEVLESSVIAGPYHPAFGELAESRIYLQKMEKALRDLGSLDGHTLVIRTRSHLVSKLVGHKKANAEELKKRYNLAGFKIIADLDKGDFILEKAAKER